MLQVVADAARDLAEEDPALAVETYFEPLRVKALASPNLANSDCSIDGYYESNVDERRPWILYSADVSPGRVRFTILHELGHHVLSTSGAHLLDDIDAIGGSPSGANLVEELACHSFAGQLLVPQTLIDAEVGDARVRPAHILSVHQKCQASWEAVAVRVAEESAYKTVVLVVRTPGQISFAATSRHFSPIRWPRGSRARASGPIAVALSRNKQVAVKDSYRWGMPYEEQLYCDTERVNDGLAIAVMGDRRSDGRFDILEEIDPSWLSKDEHCLRCGDERCVGWCDSCKGRLCRSCGKCGCHLPSENPLCPVCHLNNPRRPGASVCRDCE